MKILFIKEYEVYPAPFKNTFESIYAEHLAHFVEFASGEIGFLLKPNIAIAPATQRENCEVITSDGETTKATFLAGQRNLNYSLFYIKRTPVQECITYRQEVINPDTFLFRLDVRHATIRVCSKASSPDNQQVSLTYKKTTDFLPVIDRFGHFVGLSMGQFESRLACLRAKELTEIVQWSKPE
jgi:hypothetical protein